MGRLRLKPYIDEAATWPDRGHVILAQYDAQSVVVYQAVRPGLARYALEHERLGGADFDTERMTWLGTSFFWMMHRSRWGADRNQPVVLALWVARAVFDSSLQQAVPARYVAGAYESREAWAAALERSEVRVQWDPDFPPSGPKLARKAIQLGLRGEAARRLAAEGITGVADITPFARQQSEFRAAPDMLFTPAQDVYPVRDRQLAARLGLDKSVPG